MLLFLFYPRIACGENAQNKFLMRKEILMNNYDFTIADAILHQIRMGARGAFALSVRDNHAEIHFGASSIPNVNFFLWLNTVDLRYALTNENSEIPTFDFVFDRYGQGEANLRFALVADGKVLLDSRTMPLVGMFLIRTDPGAKQPACVIGTINHFGDIPNSTLIANRAPELVDFSNSLISTIVTMMEGLPID